MPPTTRRGSAPADDHLVLARTRAPTTRRGCEHNKPLRRNTNLRRYLTTDEADTGSLLPSRPRGWFVLADDGFLTILLSHAGQALGFATTSDGLQTPTTESPPAPTSTARRTTSPPSAPHSPTAPCPGLSPAPERPLGCGCGCRRERHALVAAGPPACTPAPAHTAEMLLGTAGLPARPAGSRLYPCSPPARVINSVRFIDISLRRPTVGSAPITALQLEGVPPTCATRVR